MDQGRALACAQLYTRIQQSARILLVADGKPDGDSIGSTTAMLRWLQREGKYARAFCANRVSPALWFLDGARDITSDSAVFQEAFDLVITLDAGDIRHAGVEKLLPSMSPKPFVAVVDHHATNTRFGDMNMVWTDACATTEVVYWFFAYNGIAVDGAMATSMLTGLCTDTGNFANSATTAQGMSVAGHLFQLGARRGDISKHLFQNKDVPTLKLWGLALERLHINTKYDLACTYLLLSDRDRVPGITEYAYEDVSNFLNAVNGETEAVMVLREVPGGIIKGSLRSIRRDISKLAKAFGGGGHKRAAGFTVRGKIVVDEVGKVSIVEG